MNTSIKILIACALKIELQALEEGLGNRAAVLGRFPTHISNIDYALFRCGLGSVKSAYRLKETLQLITPKCIINFGLAGALMRNNPSGESLNRGDLAVIDEVLDCTKSPLGNSDRRYCSDNSAVMLAHKSNISVVSLATLARPLESIDDNILLASQYQVDLVDMEAAAIHKVCDEAGLKCVTVKVVSDFANEKTNDDFFKYSARILTKAAEPIKNYLTALVKELDD